VGAFIAWILPDGNNILGTIFFDPQFQDIGVGTKTWQFIKREYPGAISWRLSSPTWATKNYHFY
jgi:hypothetical protein